VDQDVISTYLPVRFGGPQGPIEGVFELYSNVTPLLQRINATQRTIVLGICLILALLYVALFVIVRHADGIIRRQQAEQIEAEQQLLRQQRALAVLRERERLARDLHDSVGQVLAYLSVQAQAVSAHWTRGNLEEAHRLLLRLVEVVQLSHHDVRKQIQALRAGPAGETAQQIPPDAPAPLDPGDAQTDTLSGQAWAGLAVERAVENQLLRIVQEALTNIRKHAQAKHAWVLMEVDGRQAVVTIADDGNGFAADQANGTDGLHFGLQMMRARAAELGGTLEVQSAQGEGTQVTVRVPLPPAAAEEVH
jgi:signal transduction histidine kinase